VEDKPTFDLQFKESTISWWAERYEYNSEVDITSIGKTIKKQGYINHGQLKEICKWKTFRSKKKVEKNSEEFVREISAFSLSAKDERSRIESLTLLEGVRWPTASVILHFCHQEPYPILDFRALESFGIKKDDVNYNFEFWCRYVDECRKIAQRTGHDMRTIDKALWQYSKEN
jgi:hypothetical protein